MTDEAPHAYVFVDGSAGGKATIGAWAAVVVTAKERKVLYGISNPTTISRCELTPIIESLRWLRNHLGDSPGFRIAVYSDSEYTVKTLSGMYDRRKNTDLWAGLDDVASGFNIQYIWRERNSLEYMTLCDAIAGTLRKTMIELISKYLGSVDNPEATIPLGELPGNMEYEILKGELNGETGTFS